MRARGFGRIVNIGSIHSLVASPYKSAYVAAKHGLLGFTQGDRARDRRHRHHHQHHLPSYVKTPLVDKQIADQARTRGMPESEVIKEIMLKPMPKGVFIGIDELAGITAFLMSPGGAQHHRADDRRRRRLDRAIEDAAKGRTHGIQDRRLRADRQHATPPRWSRAADRSTGCARRASTPTRASRRWSATTSTAAGRCARRCRCARRSQRYRGDTLMLETEFVCDGGVVRITDFMPIGHGTAATSSASSRASKAKCRSRCCSMSASATAPTRRWITPSARRRAFHGRARRADPARRRSSSSTQDERACRRILHGQEGRSHPAAAHLVPVARAAARRRSTSTQALARDRRVLAGVGGPLHLPRADGAKP